MMQCVRRCSFICVAVLSILLLLCSCQAGAGPLILPENVPSKNASQGKEKLLAALNQEYFDRFKRSNYFIQGSDSAAEAVFLYLAQNSGGDINKAVEFLAENPEDEDGRANCADDVLRIISPSPSKTYWVSYSFLSANMLEDGVLKENAAFGPARRPSDASGVLLSFWQRKRRLCRRRHRRSGTRRGSVRFLIAFFKTNKNDRCGLLFRSGHFLCPPYWANHFILL